MAARPSRRAAAFARAALLAFAAALMRHVPAAVLSRAAPAVLGRAEESSPGLTLQPLRGGGPAAEGRDDSADLSLQVASSSMELPRRSLERLRAPDELNAARITLARPARRDVGLPGAASGVATSQAVPPAVPLTAPPFSVPPQLSAPPPQLQSTGLFMQRRGLRGIATSNRHGVIAGPLKKTYEYSMAQQLSRELSEKKLGMVMSS